MIVVCALRITSYFVFEELVLLKMIKNKIKIAIAYHFYFWLACIKFFSGVHQNIECELSLETIEPVYSERTAYSIIFIQLILSL